MPSIKQINLQIFNETLKKYPNTTHMYLRRNDHVFNGDVIDVPVNHVLSTLGVNPTWELLMSTEQVDSIVTDLFQDEKGAIEEESAELFKEDSQSPYNVPEPPEPISEEDFKEIIGEKPKKAQKKAKRSTKKRSQKV